MTDWRDDEADEAEFDKGFEQFIKDRKIKVFKKGEIPSPLGLHLKQDESVDQN